MAYSYEGERLGQGRENAKEYIKNNPEFMQMLNNKVKEMEKARLLAANNLEES